MSNKCFAGIRKVTSHSERNSIILASSLERMFWVALNAGSRSGTCAVVGTPTVPLAYSSAKKSRHILETHWLGFSMSIVILARPCWLTMALKYLQARMAALRVLGPSSVWFHPLTWPIGVFCGSFVLLLVLGHSHNDTQDVIMHVIPIAGGDPTSLCRFCFGLVVVVCLLLVFVFLFLVCFFVCFLAGTVSGLRTGPLPALLWLSTS